MEAKYTSKFHPLFWFCLGMIAMLAMVLLLLALSNATQGELRESQLTNCFYIVENDELVKRCRN